MTRTEPPARTSPPRLPSLTGLRFFAALLVFGFHITLSTSPIAPHGPINPFANPGIAALTERLFIATGFIGVSFFFVLSGFVLTWSARPGDGVLSFWRRRIVKIFPNHLVMWALVMLLYAAAVTPVHAWVLNLFLLSAYSPDGTVSVAVNSPSWTLCAELLFYLLFPLLIRGIRRIPAGALWLWAGLVLAGMVLLQVAVLTVVPDMPQNPFTHLSPYQFWFGYIFPPSRLLEFLLGAVLARIVLEHRWPAVRRWQVLAACVAGYAAANLLPLVWVFNVATIIPIALLVATAAADDAAGRHTFLRSGPMQWLGDTSFGFYLCQGVTIFWVRHMMGNATYPAPVALAVVAGVLALTLAGGWALHALVEKPMMDRFARPRRTTGTTGHADDVREPA
ncbi:acyltransferase family protein [Myceligenerans indicum]|uniref:Acyltransferase n=1 Tax=Myceligenerans indicum TaxID=2593663 RepID=A0ABS1LRR9_9MICO|nr:acyltransferase [Myceligenerans indicum]MBL0888940.1 acyltransferase [Myceligenerans indicum]